MEITMFHQRSNILSPHLSTTFPPAALCFSFLLKPQFVGLVYAGLVVFTGVLKYQIYTKAPEMQDGRGWPGIAL